MTDLERRVLAVCVGAMKALATGDKQAALDLLADAYEAVVRAQIAERTSVKGEG